MWPCHAAITMVTDMYSVDDREKALLYTHGHKLTIDVTKPGHYF